MKINQIKSQIKKIAKEFDLKYKAEWFNIMWISKRQEILTEFIGDCPDPLYNKYGKSLEQRIRNLNKFVNSKDFLNCLKRFGGQVAEKRTLKKEENWYKKIQNKKIRLELLKLNAKIKTKLKKTNQIALLTKTNIKKEKDWLGKYILRHEWIHILLHKNKVSFQEVHKKYWSYDEGINEYLGAYLDRTLNKLEKFRDKETYPMEKKNWVYAIKFRELLKNKTTSKQRKETIKELVKRLNKDAKI